MSWSHTSNCEIHLVDFEQLHVDGNKSLVYSMVNFTLLPEDQNFDAPGKVGYVFNPTVISNPGNPNPTPPPNLSPQPNQLNIVLNQANNFLYPFEVLGPESTPLPTKTAGWRGPLLP